MTDELFTTPETLSPRLRWMREHGIQAWFEDDSPIRPWTASHEADVGDTYAYGDTEDEALVNLAKRLGIKLWNEQ